MGPTFFSFFPLLLESASSASANPELLRIDFLRDLLPSSTLCGKEVVTATDIASSDRDSYKSGLSKCRFGLEPFLLRCLLGNGSEIADSVSGPCFLARSSS